jgi:hypothetical protein
MTSPELTCATNLNVKPHSLSGVRGKQQNGGKKNPVTNQQFFTLEVHIIAMETEFRAVFHDTSRPKQLSRFCGSSLLPNDSYPYSCGSVQ